jgi:hypothetical protein
LRGIVWNVHSFFPVRTSNAITSALTFALFTRTPTVSAGPTTITPLAITGGELLPMRPVGSIEPS